MEIKRYKPGNIRQSPDGTITVLRQIESFQPPTGYLRVGTSGTFLPDLPCPFHVKFNYTKPCGAIVELKRCTNPACDKNGSMVSVGTCFHCPLRPK